ncbi:hypothetical protein Cob_v008331 [Colletotrichum orbiculare MAFF 240422]|uniref:Uncharacterized protein n=1 Tax=Colletotrichum orbiculare (strain 104-T / ATCC 96160 / CBS 514.97 / LARS 414 / MAFF 240422) TaxID=1213857 RepID=A0A484FMZ2_COLOR|nr:hypothetical protein Cob_v008331 [Colletotrichum orbiculare MAFF 240422]
MNLFEKSNQSPAVEGSSRAGAVANGRSIANNGPSSEESAGDRRMSLSLPAVNNTMPRVTKVALESERVASRVERHVRTPSQANSSSDKHFSLCLSVSRPSLSGASAADTEPGHHGRDEVTSGEAGRHGILEQSLRSTQYALDSMIRISNANRISVPCAPYGVCLPPAQSLDAVRLDASQLPASQGQLGVSTTTAARSNPVAATSHSRNPSDAPCSY